MSARVGANKLKKQVLDRSKYTKRTKRPLKSTTLASYVGAFLFIITIVAIGYEPPKSTTIDSVAHAANVQSTSLLGGENSAPSVDQLIATRVAAGIAERAELPIARNIAEISISLSIESELAQVDNNAIVKPQIIQPTAGNREIRSYTTVSGDTVDKLAAQFGVSADTIKWANDLTSSALEPGKNLQIPPVNGIIYTVKDGDTASSIAEKYRSDERTIVSFNDLELAGLKVGQKIILPDGNLPTTERPGYVAPAPQTWVAQAPIRYGAGFSSGKTWTIGYGTASNKYAFGNCTAYAFNRRAQLGKPVGGMWGNAATWAYYAQAEGYLVNNVPSVGAVIQNGGGYGHVGVVEEILPNGDISVSEMNAYVPGGGFNIVSGRVIPASSVGSYSYIH